MSISIVPESYVDIISKRIASLFGNSPEETRKFITNLQTKDTDRLRDFYDLLPSIEFESKRRSRASEGKPLHRSIVNGPSALDQ